MGNLKVIANELVPVYEQNKDMLVSARDLHGFLDVGKDFSNWIKDRIEKYGFEDGIDYTPILANRSDGLPGKPRIEYYFKLEPAKEIAMVENNEQGRRVRRYFIAVEKKAREMFSIPKTLPEALRLAADLAEQIEKNAPKVLFAEKCLKSNDSILIRELAKIACGEGLNTGEHRLYKALREWKLLSPDNEPYQQYVNKGYFEIVETPYETEYGVRIARTTRVLPKGQEYIINRLQKQVI